MSAVTALERIRDRSLSLGRIGAALRQAVPAIDADFPNWGLARQYAYVYACAGSGNYVGAAATSLLCCDATVQVAYKAELCEWIVRNGYGEVDHGRYTKTVNGWTDGALPPADWVRVKPHPAAASKTNVYFREMMRSAKAYAPAVYTNAIKWRNHLHKMTNDQACGAMLYACGAAKFYGWDLAMRVAIGSIEEPDTAKAIGAAIKALGQTVEIAGAVLAETTCLLGRGVAEIDVRARALERVAGHGTPCPQLFDDEVLRAAIQELLADEIDLGKIRISGDDEFWDSRWAWCVNGSHSKMVERHDKRWAVPVGGQVHRRVAIENWTENPLAAWDGYVYVSPSAKLEHGKTRLLLACDTVSYINFEHLMQAVEPAWKGKRIILDPGKGGAMGIARRVRNMGEGACYAALDYDDFNSQHTLTAQQILIEETCKLIGYDSERTARLVGSFEKMIVCYGGKDLGKAHSTLMSGHRCTTYINSVLNAAYIKCASGRLFSSLKSMHVGDDIIAACAGPNEAEELLRYTQATQCKMNPLKQSIGIVSGEFLRMSISKKHACGYYARSVASAVSGNWTSDRSLSPPDRLRTMIVQARSLINRCGLNETVALLLVHAAAKRTGVKQSLLRRLLTGAITLGPGPVYMGDNTIREYEYIDTKRREERESYREYGCRATTAYLTNAITEVERVALTAANVSVKNAMVEASYMKSLATRTDTSSTVGGYNLKFSRAYRLPGSCTAREALGHDRWTGVLGKYPILQLVRQRLPVSIVRELVKTLAPKMHNVPLEVAAWGYESCGYRLVGVLPYSDAAAISSRMAYGIVYVDYNVFM